MSRFLLGAESDVATMTGVLDLTPAADAHAAAPLSPKLPQRRTETLPPDWPKPPRPKQTRISTVTNPGDGNANRAQIG